MNKKITEKKAKSALLIMDVQTRIVGMVSNPDPLINSIKKAISHARSAQIPVIYVVVSFRKGFPEISVNNKSFSAIKNNMAAFADIKETQVYHEVTPEAYDIVITKRRVSAFTGSDLEVVLRSLSAS